MYLSKKHVNPWLFVLLSGSGLVGCPELSSEKLQQNSLQADILFLPASSIMMLSDAWYALCGAENCTQTNTVLPLKLVCRGWRPCYVVMGTGPLLWNQTRRQTLLNTPRPLHVNLPHRLLRWISRMISQLLSYQLEDTVTLFPTEAADSRWTPMEFMTEEVSEQHWWNLQHFDMIPMSLSYFVFLECSKVWRNLENEALKLFWRLLVEHHLTKHTKKCDHLWMLLPVSMAEVTMVVKNVFAHRALGVDEMLKVLDIV